MTPKGEALDETAGTSGVGFAALAPAGCPGSNISSAPSQLHDLQKVPHMKFLGQLHKTPHTAVK